MSADDSDPQNEKPTSPGGLAREQLESLIEEGLTIRQIARTLDRHPVTVRRWLFRHGLKTRASETGKQNRADRAAGLQTVNRVCPSHGETIFVLSRDGYYRCRRCRVESVTRRRRKVKETLALEAGGCCVICGYGRYVGALEFHHINPAEKRLGMAMGGITLSIDRLREEVAKCVLLCANCHAEVEGGVSRLPLE